MPAGYWNHAGDPGGLAARQGRRGDPEPYVGTSRSASDDRVREILATMARGVRQDTLPETWRKPRTGPGKRALLIGRRPSPRAVVRGGSIHADIPAGAASASSPGIPDQPG